MCYLIKKIMLFFFLLSLALCMSNYLFNSKDTPDGLLYKVGLIKKKSNYNTVILGDSRSLCIDYFKESCDGVYNFSTFNPGGMYPYLYLLKELIKSESHVDTIVLSVIPINLGSYFDIFRREPPHIEDSTFYRSSKLYSLDEMLNPFEHVVFFKYPKSTLYLIYRKIIVKKYTLEKFNHVSKDNSFNEKTGGAFFSTKNIVWDAMSIDPRLIPKEYEPSENSIVYLEELLRIAKENSIKVFMFNMPIPEALYNLRKRRAFYGKYYEVVLDLKKTYSDTLFVYNSVISFPNNYFSDGSHLNLNGVNYFQKNYYKKMLNKENYL